MDQKQIFRQMLDLNKMAFNNAFNAMVMVQDQTEFLANNMLNQSTGIPEEGKKSDSGIGEFVQNGSDRL